jgi:hypothetical protein
MLVDLRGDALDVSHYCLRHRRTAWAPRRAAELAAAGPERPCVWVTLSEHTGDTALAAHSFDHELGIATAGWAVEGVKGPFSQFRVLVTGLNTGHNGPALAGYANREPRPSHPRRPTR